MKLRQVNSFAQRLDCVLAQRAQSEIGAGCVTGAHVGVHIKRYISRFEQIFASVSFVNFEAPYQRLFSLRQHIRRFRARTIPTSRSRA